MGNSDVRARTRTAIAVGLVAVAALALENCTPPGQSPLKSCLTPRDQARYVTLKTSTGDSVMGAVLGTGRVGIVLAPKVIDDACVWVPFARRLRDRGDRALLFDWKTNLVGGQVTGVAAVAEVVSAAEELRREGSDQVLLIGASKGGTASLVAASVVRPEVEGVASLSGEADYADMDAMKSVQTLTLPVLFMAAENDHFGSGSPNDTKTMSAACRSPNKRLVMLPGTEHGEELLAGPAKAQANNDLDEFIAAATAASE